MQELNDKCGNDAALRPLHPVRSMPHWAYLTTYANPMDYFANAIRIVLVRGGIFLTIVRQVLALLGIFIVHGRMGRAKLQEE